MSPPGFAGAAFISAANEPAPRTDCLCSTRFNQAPRDGFGQPVEMTSILQNAKTVPGRSLPKTACKKRKYLKVLSWAGYFSAPQR
jgi:hypothetical protein